MVLKNNKRAKEALFIGLLCSISYLAVYIARNVLSTVTPQMVEGGEYTKEYIGEISSLFFIFYALGQLLNGFLGDKIKARYMLSIGLLLAGVINFAFPYILHLTGIARLAYGSTGFFLSMIYAPMTKLVAENTMPEYTTKCSLGYTLASYLGSPMAGAVAAILSWKSVFVTSSIALVVMAIVCFASIFYLEKSGVVIHNRYKELREAKKEKRRFLDGAKILVKRRILLFALISMLTGVVRTTVVFWLPTYFSEYLGYAPRTSAAIFTVATLAISLTVFLSVAVYKLFKQNLYSTVLVTFLASALFFLFVYLVEQPVINIIFIVLGVMSANAAATMLWSMYCPSLHDTGMVSAATGFLAFIGYIASSASSTLFANAATTIGWGNLILVWSGLMALGVIVTLPRIFIKSK
ncbi:MAG: MFS transporter [Clostridia bacterium]|nr:MFS transporter [Clostridia bacterium]